MRGKIISLFTTEQHQNILRQHSCNVLAAAAYYDAAPKGITVSRQLVKYWRLIYADGLKPKASLANNILRKDRKLKDADPLGKGGLFNPDKTYSCILVIPDQHAPYHHQDAIPFLKHVASQFQPELVVNLGDEADKHAMSFHDSDPNLMSAGDELEAAKKWLGALAKEFPNQLVCDSNHGSMHFRKAKAHGIPVQYLKSYREVLFPDGGGEGWNWAENWRVNTPLGPVMFKHQPSGPILVDAAHNQCNLMVGHHHGNFSVEYTASSAALYWGAYSGCLIDKDSLAYAYGKHTLRKPVIGCTVILNGCPMLVPMLMGKDGRWVGAKA